MGGERTQTSSLLRKNILQILNDEKTHTINQLKQELADNGFIFDQDYNTNHLSGALNRLKAQGSIKCIGRGTYQKEPETSSGIIPISLFDSFEDFKFPKIGVFSKLRNKVNDDLQKEIEMITAEVNNIDISNMDQDDWKDLNYILNIKKFLEKQLGE